MRLFCEALWAQKAGNERADYEDAFWPKRRVSGDNRACMSVAVADGATESSFSRLWAKQLARAYCNAQGDSEAFLALLPSLQRSWAKFVSRKPLPWYAEEKARIGAFSTILGLTLRDGDTSGNSGSWEALAVGDSCLVQIRGDAILTTFPLSSSEEFNNSPFLLGSIPESNKHLDSQLRHSNGEWESGDSFYLMTDAVAACFLRQVEEHKSPWQAVRDLDFEPSLPFTPWVDELRKDKILKNDDVTIYRLVLS